MGLQLVSVGVPDPQMRHGRIKDDVFGREVGDLTRPAAGLDHRMDEEAGP